METLTADDFFRAGMISGKAKDTKANELKVDACPMRGIESVRKYKTETGATVERRLASCVFIGQRVTGGVHGLERGMCLSCVANGGPDISNKWLQVAGARRALVNALRPVDAATPGPDAAQLDRSIAFVKEAWGPDWALRLANTIITSRPVVLCAADGVSLDAERVAALLSKHGLLEAALAQFK